MGVFLALGFLLCVGVLLVGIQGWGLGIGRGGVGGGVDGGEGGGTGGKWLKNLHNNPGEF